MEEYKKALQAICKHKDPQTGKSILYFDTKKSVVMCAMCGLELPNDSTLTNQYAKAIYAANGIWDFYKYICEYYNGNKERIYEALKENPRFSKIDIESLKDDDGIVAAVFLKLLTED